MADRWRDFLILDTFFFGLVNFAYLCIVDARQKRIEAKLDALLPDTDDRSGL